MKHSIIQILKKQGGKKSMQGIYNSLFRLSLWGLNYGNGGDFKDSGELHVLKFIKEKLKGEKYPVIFDVGSNIGNYSKNVANIFKDNFTIHSFEPSQKTFEIYLRTVAGIANIIPNNFGLSDTEADLTLYSNVEASGLASLYQRNLQHFGISMDKSEKIKLSTIDHYCNKMAINRINFLKLDIEGHELSALRGAKQMIEGNNIDFIQFEFGGCNIDSRTYFQDFFYLLKDRYRIYRILTNGLAEIPNYNETNEIFITINYLAINKNL